MIENQDSDLHFGARVLHTALSAPFNQLLQNGGERVPALAQAEILREAPGLVFDVMDGEIKVCRRCRHSRCRNRSHQCARNSRQRRDDGPECRHTRAAQKGEGEL